MQALGFRLTYLYSDKQREAKQTHLNQFDAMRTLECAQ